MKFFKPEDFQFAANIDMFHGYEMKCAKLSAEAANVKLEREGKVVYSEHKGWSSWNPIQDYTLTHKALLICIEPIEKCKHPVEKIKVKPYTVRCETQDAQDKFGWLARYQCECGAKVKPKEFEVCE